MHIEERKRFREIANHVVRIGRQSLAITQRSPRIKADGSYCTTTDKLIDRYLISLIRETWPTVGFCTEESAPHIPNEPAFVLIDSVDGTSNYVQGGRQWSILLGYIENGAIEAVCASQPALSRTYLCFTDGTVWEFNYLTWDWAPYVPKRVPFVRLGADLGPDSPPQYRFEVENIDFMRKRRYINGPAGDIGLRVFRKEVAAVWSHTYHLWDLSVTLLIRRSGGVAEHLDGSPIQWNHSIKPGPVLMASSQEHADGLREALQRLREKK